MAEYIDHAQSRHPLLLKQRFLQAPTVANSGKHSRLTYGESLDLYSAYGKNLGGHPISRITETWSAKLFYGVGSVAYGVKDNAFQVYLLYYYTLIQEMSAALVATALLIAVMIDSITDPLVGQFSDNLRTRIGRRHPLMFAAAIPVALSFFFLWSPPEGLSESGLFWYLLLFASLTRIFITFYEIPGTALVTELTQDYDQRVSFGSVRYFFGWIGGAGISMFALATFFADSAAFPNGLLNPDAYISYALLGAGLMFATTLISAGGTLKYVPHLVQDMSEKIDGLAAMLKNLWSVVTDSVFAPLFGAAMLTAMGLGVTVSTSLFFYTYFWDFSTAQMVTLGLSVLIGAGLAPVLAPIVTKGKQDKRSAAIRLALGVTLLGPLPVALRLLGLMPENGSDILLPILFVTITTVIAMGVTAEILIHAMVADVVEDNELRTGRRSAGVFFAARTFAAKSTNGLGVLVGALIIGAAGLEKGMSPELATPDMVATLGYLYVPVLAVIYGLAAFLIIRFKITRARHEDNLAALNASED